MQRSSIPARIARTASGAKSNSSSITSDTSRMKSPSRTCSKTVSSPRRTPYRSTHRTPRCPRKRARAFSRFVLVSRLNRFPRNLLGYLRCWHRLCERQLAKPLQRLKIVCRSGKAQVRFLLRRRQRRWKDVQHRFECCFSSVGSSISRASSIMFLARLPPAKDPPWWETHGVAKSIQCNPVTRASGRPPLNRPALPRGSNMRFFL